MERLRPHIAGVILLQMCLLKLPGAKAMTSFHLAMTLGVYLAVAIWVMSLDLFAGCFLITAIVSHWLIGGNPFDIGYFQLLAVWFLFVVTWARDTEAVKGYICALGVLHALIILVQVTVGDPLMIDNRTGEALREPCGVCGNRNEAAALAALCAVAMFKGWLRYLLIFPVAAIVAAKSFVGVFTLGIAGIAFVFFEGRRKQALVVAGVSVVAGLLYSWLVDAPTIDVRLQIINAAIAKYGWDILQGIGPGQFFVVVPFGPERFAHNELVQYTVEMGAIIPVLFAGLLFTSTRSGPPMARAALVAAVAASMAYHVIHIPVIAAVIVTWAAIRIEPWTKQQSQRQSAAT